MTFDECLKFLDNHQEELSSEMPVLDIIDIMIGTIYSLLRDQGLSRKIAMQMILWGVFYFAQQETGFTGDAKRGIIEAMQAAKANAYFVSGHREEEEEE